jgi:hypothetical protein
MSNRFKITVYEIGNIIVPRMIGKNGRARALAAHGQIACAARITNTGMLD